MVQCISEQCVNDSIAFCIPTCCSCFSFSFAYYFLFVLLITMIFHIKLNHVFTIAQHSLIVQFQRSSMNSAFEQRVDKQMIKIEIQVIQIKNIFILYFQCRISVEIFLSKSTVKIKQKPNWKQNQHSKTKFVLTLNRLTPKTFLRIYLILTKIISAFNSNYSFLFVTTNISSISPISYFFFFFSKTINQIFRFYQNKKFFNL